MKYKTLCIPKEATVRDALKQLDLTAQGILFVVDKGDFLQGTLTDGDIRRHILSGGSLDDGLENATHENPRVASDRQSAKALYDPKSYYAIPIVDGSGRLIDAYFGEGNSEDKLCARLNIPVVVNAGGKGTRLDPFTKVLPKPLIPVGEYPIIEHIFRQYQKYECNDFHVIVNYKKDIMKAYFTDSRKSYALTWYDEDKPLGTGGGLSLLKGRMQGTFFFTNCDILLTADYEGMLKFHKDQGNLITMICAYKTMSVPYGVVEMGKDGTIEEMREKPEYTFLTNTGMYIVEPEVLDYIEDDTPVGFPDVVEKLRSLGKKVAAYPVRENEWYDMGQLPELERMRARLYEN